MLTWLQDNLPVIITVIFALFLALLFILLEEKYAPFTKFRKRVRALPWFVRVPIWAVSMAIIVGIHALFQQVSFLMFGEEFSVVPIFLIFLAGVTLALALLLPEEDAYELDNISTPPPPEDEVAADKLEEENEPEGSDEH